MMSTNSLRCVLSSCDGSANLGDVRHFMCNEFQVSPTIAMLCDQLHGATQHLSDGLAVWLPRISHSSDVIRIQATAGSGKTQLALCLLADAVAANEPCYICWCFPIA